MTSSSSPVWQVKGDGAFAAVSITLPPGSSCHCESDAVVTMSQGVDVAGTMSGGILGSLARRFLTQESFFTTTITNSSSNTGDVLLAPSDPGGVALHRLQAGEELILAPGAYLGGDDGIQITSEAHSPLSGIGHFGAGAGMFLLKASGNGTLAVAARCGSVLKYTLQPGETRSVDNGHLVAWSGSMLTQRKLASSRRQGVVGSVSSGEGFHIGFAGPGVVLVQTHKPPQESGRSASRSRSRSSTNGGGGGGTGILGILFALIVYGLSSQGILDGVLDGAGTRRSGRARSSSRRTTSSHPGSGTYGTNHYDL